MSELLLPVELRFYWDVNPGCEVLFGGRHLFRLEQIGTNGVIVPARGGTFEAALPEELVKAAKRCIAQGQIIRLREWAKRANTELASAEAALKESP